VQSDRRGNPTNEEGAAALIQEITEQYRLIAFNLIAEEEL
jgi:hypothetical protein